MSIIGTVAIVITAILLAINTIYLGWLIYVVLSERKRIMKKDKEEEKNENIWKNLHRQQL